MYLALGTSSQAAATAAFWNPFLTGFGLEAEPFIHGVNGPVSVSSPHPVLEGVSCLWHSGGQSVVDLDPAHSANQVIDEIGGTALFTVYDGRVLTAAPMEISAAAGGSQVLSIEAGSAYGDMSYWVLGTTNNQKQKLFQGLVHMLAFLSLGVLTLWITMIVKNI